jgi:hypothetical protein
MGNPIYLYPVVDHKAKVNSLYNKLYCILTEIINTNRLSDEEIYAIIKSDKHTPFLIDKRTNQYVNKKRVEYYLKILTNLSFVKNVNDKYELNSYGLTAIRNEGNVYNKILIKRLYHWLLNKQTSTITWEAISAYRTKTTETLISLIKDFQIPSFLNFKHRFEALHNENIINDRNDLKVILTLLSYTKEIKRLDTNSYFTY